jgi:hypothetical protein
MSGELPGGLFFMNRFFGLLKVLLKFFGGIQPFFLKKLRIASKSRNILNLRDQQMELKIPENP